MFNYTPKMDEIISYKLHKKTDLKEFNTANKATIVLDILLSGNVMTVADAALNHEIFCLSQIISHLRHYRKIPVKTKMRNKVGQNGRYAEYYLAQTDIADVLKRNPSYE